MLKRRLALALLPVAALFGLEQGELPLAESREAPTALEPDPIETPVYYSGELKRVHDGLYLSMGVGAGWGRTALFDHLFAQDLKVASDSGMGYHLDFRLGGTFLNRWVLYGEIGNSIQPTSLIAYRDYIYHYDPFYSYETYNTKEYSSAVLMTTVGVGLDYYWIPYNIVVGAGIGLGSLMISPQRSDGMATLPGFNLRCSAGKEWWIADDWAVGFRVSYAAYSAGRLHTNADSHWKMVRAEFTATFN